MHGDSQLYRETQDSLAFETCRKYDGRWGPEPSCDVKSAVVCIGRVRLPSRTDECHNGSNTIVCFQHMMMAGRHKTDSKTIKLTNKVFSR